MDEEEEDKTPAPLGNGGATDKFVWTQVSVPPDIMYMPCVTFDFLRHCPS